MAGNPTLPTENIDEVILRLLALEPNEVDELDYETYTQYLKELLVGISTGRKIDSGEAELVQKEFKRVRGKKGRFKISSRKSKITADKLGIGFKGVRKQVAGTQKRLMLAPVGGIKQPIEAIAKKSSDSDVLNRISNTLDSILQTLTNINRFNATRIERERRDAESRRRSGRERELEFKPIEGIKKAISTITKPFQSIWDKILNFITNIILGRIVLKLIDWIADPENQGKIQSIIRFFSDHWPTLLALYLRFGTGIGRFVGKLSGILIRGIFKLGQLAIKLALKAGIGKAGGKLSKVAGFLGGKGGKLLTAGLGIATDVAITAGTSNIIDNLAGGEEKTSIPTQQFSGGGLARVPKFAGGGFANFGKMFGGVSLGSMFSPLGKLFNFGTSSGFVKGPKGRDKVPAMLTDGEFVMSTGAVQKYGLDTLEAMNAAGGGTNIPQIAEGVTHAAGGGYIGKTAEHLKSDEALSSLTKGSNDAIRPGGTSFVTRKPWNSVKPQTILHAYETGVSGDRTTIGWGSTFYDSILNGRKPVKPGDTITKSQADQILNTNILNLSKTYSQKIPTWNKMSDDQRAGVLLVGYNAPYGPIGAYPNLTSALKSGNMVAAAENVRRGGPSPTRLATERKLILSGPKTLEKPGESKSSSKPKSEPKSEPKPQQKNWWQSLMSSFSPPKYADGGLATQPPMESNNKLSPPKNQQILASNIKPKNIKPLPQNNPQLVKLNLDGTRINNTGVNPPTTASKPPSLPVTHGNTRLAQATLGVVKHG